MNVDLSDSIVITESDGKRSTRYKCFCPTCGKNRGYHKKNRWNKKCRSCVQIGKNKTNKEKIKQSCIKQGIPVRNFNGFKKTENQRDRIKFDRMGLAKSCFERFDYICQKCNKRGGNLNAHHVNNWSDYPNKRFDENNLICLCEQCHIEFHSKFGYKNNNLDQLTEFIKT